MLREPGRESRAHQSDFQHKDEIQRHPPQELPATEAAKEDKVAIASDESFPASDAPSWTMGKR